RIGRSGRAGRTCTAITIVAPVDRKAVGAIERLIGQTIPWMNKPAPDEVRESQPTNTDQPSHSQRSRARRRRRKSAHQAKKAGPVHKAACYQPAQESDGGHLPAFLLRPVSVKA